MGQVSGVKNPPPASIRVGHTAVQDGGRAPRYARGQLRTSRRPSSRASGPAVFLDDSYLIQPSQSSRRPSRSAGSSEIVGEATGPTRERSTDFLGR